jgi:chemotaxis protein MotB
MFQRETKKAGAPGWMCTFADLMCLLMTFSVLLLTMSSTELAKFKAMAGSMQQAFGTSNRIIQPISMSDEILPSDANGPTTASELEREVLKRLAEAGGLKGDKSTVIVQLESDLLFASGDATLTPAARPPLRALARVMAGTDYSLDVVGHTDNVPIATAEFPSNWELSAARAGQAVRYLAEQGVPPARLRAIGRADTAPVSDNLTARGRERNRRVELIFTKYPEPQRMTLPAVVEATAAAADRKVQ